LYTHPYSGIQPVPIPNPTLSEYHYPASGNTGYPSFPPSLTADFDSTSGFGYTKQITPLWNESSTVRSNEDQSLATNLDQHKHSKHVAEISSGEVVDINGTSEQDKSSSSKLSRETAENLRTKERERGTFKSPEKNSSSSQTSVRSKDNSDLNLLKHEEISGSRQSRETRSSGSGTHADTISDASPFQIQKDKSRTPESPSSVDEDVTTTDNAESSFKPG
jgi:hypothetical protein